MTTTYITMRGATLRFALTEAELTPPATGAEDVSCQISDANVVPGTTTETAAATLCADAVDTVTGLTYTLNIVAFQDWSDPDGMSWFLETNALDLYWFELALAEGGNHRGQVNLVPLQYGGAAGSNLTGSSAMPVQNHASTPPAAATRARGTTKKAAAAAA